MTEKTPQPIHRADYAPPPYLVESIELHFDLSEETTLVRSRLALRRNPAGAGGPLVLNGEELRLLNVRLDGRELDPAEYRLDEETLTLPLPDPPQAFALEVTTAIRPAENTSLEGLYVSGGNFCTQCEAQGFRKITYYPDRPDVLARFSTTLAADRVKFPVLLANGNLVGSGDLEGGRHFATWEDPFPKPGYLFALVAGDLACVEDSYETASGRSVALRIYTEERNRDKCGHAMASLKRAMRWDEETFGLEYDLDIYMIVAVDDFNFGAMENKGLNVFNSKYVLAKPETATDADYQGIEGVIGHEYFHNWTGNRVTCRDWFQLSLKEGLTVFRDQEFSAAMTSPAVKRIEEVRILRNAQFPEDGGPMAHPVRPESYVEINNFYTTTVYNKGAEVIRMYHTLLGPERFREGLRLYLSRHDGQAATVDDFLAAMAEAGGRDLSRFALWYSQAGTPELAAEASWDEEARSYTLSVRQSCPATPGQEAKEPFHIPLTVGLLDAQGREIPLRLEGETAPGAAERVLELTQEEQTFRFVDVPERPVPSLLRDFSAPVTLRFDYSDGELAFLMAHDGDPFNRWEAGQQLVLRVSARLVDRHRRGEALELDPLLAEAFAKTLLDTEADEALLALALTLPAETFLGEQMEVIDPEAVRAVRQFLRRELARTLEAELIGRYRSLEEPGPYSVEPRAVGRRSLKNLCLATLMTLEEGEGVGLCLEQLRRGGNMTDELAALSCLADSDLPGRQEALDAFYGRWRHEPLVLDKWFTLQAASKRAGTLAEVKRLAAHPDFNIKNPNRVRALVGAFSMANPAAFHAASGEGYAFLADRVLELDPLNPMGAARLAGGLSRWRRYDEGRQRLMRGQLKRILDTGGISRDLYEVVSKSLG